MNPPQIAIWLLLLCLGCLYGSSLGLKHQCPPDKAIEPCVCIDLDEVRMLSCEVLDENRGKLLKPTIFATAGYDIQNFYLQNSILETVPDNLFEGSNFVNILVQDVAFRQLDPFAMLSGIKDTVERIQIENLTVDKWTFSNAANFKKLKYFSYSGASTPPQFPDNFLELLPATIIGIEFKNGGLKKITEPGFARFPNLELVNLQGNLLFEISRSLLPNPAAKLTTLDLTNNVFVTLPSNIFEGMPALTNVQLGYNRFIEFDEDTFKPIWRQLETLHLGGNRQHCDCESSSWLITKPGPKLLTTPVCLSPESLKHRPLSNISLSELCPSS